MVVRIEFEQLVLFEQIVFSSDLKYCVSSAAVRFYRFKFYRFTFRVSVGF